MYGFNANLLKESMIHTVYIPDSDHFTPYFQFEKKKHIKICKNFMGDFIRSFLVLICCLVVFLLTRLMIRRSPKFARFKFKLSDPELLK